MKPILLLSFLIASAIPCQSQNNKQFLLSYFNTTETQLNKSVSGLSEAQMTFKPNAESWSVAQCLEHIIATEQAIFKSIKEEMAKPANRKEMGDPATTDEQIMLGVTDRTSKFKATAELQPKGKYTSPKVAMQDLIAQRAKILSFIKGTTDDALRNHVSQSPFGKVDAYQSLLFLAGHTARHTLQIQEVKANTGFPK